MPMALGGFRPFVVELSVKTIVWALDKKHKPGLA